MKERFRQDYVADERYVLEGELLNRMAATLNAAGQTKGEPGQHTRNATAVSIGYIPPRQLGLAVIVDASNVCQYDQNARYPSPDAPCASAGRYLVRFGYYDHLSGIWRTVDEVLRLDASAYSPSPALSVGNTFTCYWDEQRGWLIPIISPPDQVVTTEWEDNRDPATASPAIDLSAGSSPVLQYGVTCTLEYDNGAGWRSVNGRDLSLDMPNSSGAYVSGTMFTAFPAADGTKIRLRAGQGTRESKTAVAVSWGVRLWAIGRGWLPSGSAHVDHPEGYAGFVTLSPLVIHAESQGRWRDLPSFEYVGDGMVRVNAPGTQVWTLYADFRLEIRVEDDVSSISSSQSSSSASISGQSSLSASSGQQSSGVSEFSEGDCVEVVTHVECVDGRLRVVKCNVCAEGVRMRCEEESGSFQSSEGQSSGGSSASSVSSASSASSQSSSSQSSSSSGGSSLSSASSESSSSASNPLSSSSASTLSSSSSSRSSSSTSSLSSVSESPSSISSLSSMSSSSA